MAWKWFEVEKYRASVGANAYHAIVQLFGPSGSNFYASIKFPKSGTPSGSNPGGHGNSFWGNLEYAQMAAFVDLLRNESPVRFGWDDANHNNFQLMSGDEPVGEGDGLRT